MTESLFFTSEAISIERMSWLVEVMKYYSMKIYPGSLHHHPRTPGPPFTLFFSGDASHCIMDRQYLQFWEVLFRLPPLKFVFDQQELDVRGISVEPFMVRSPDQLETASGALEGRNDSFWDLIIRRVSNGDRGSPFGVLNLQSPCMYRSSFAMIDLLKGAVKNELSPEFYGYLDGIYAVHTNQQPLDTPSMNYELQEILSSAVKKDLKPLFLSCSSSSGERGFNTYIGDKGKIISTCTIPPVKIRNLLSIAERFRDPHSILSHTSFFITPMKHRKMPEIRPTGRKDPPPLILFVSHYPYGMEMTLGAISLALACANSGILTRVVFIEDGVHTLIGHHNYKGDVEFNLQSLIESTADQDNLEYYSYIPSFQKRGLLGGNSLKCVTPVGPTVLAQLLFQAPVGNDAGNQRAIIF